MKAADRAHSHLLRGFDRAWEMHGRVPLGHDILDPRTMERGREMSNIPVMTNLVGFSAGLPGVVPVDVSRKAYQNPKKINKPEGPGQTLKNKLAGVVVDPTRIEMHTGAESTTINEAGGYGIAPSTLVGNTGSAG